MANVPGSTAFAPGQSDERALFCSNYKCGTSEHSRTDAIRNSPLISLAVKDAVNNNNNKKPAPKPGANPVVNPQTYTLLGSTDFAGVEVGCPLFPASPSQKPQTTTNQPPSFSFGKSNQASDSNVSMPAPTPNIFEAQYSASCASIDRAASSQHKRQASSQNVTASSEGAGTAKSPKLENQSSSTNGRFASNGGPGSAVSSGKENVKPPRSRHCHHKQPPVLALHRYSPQLPRPTYSLRPIPASTSLARRTTEKHLNSLLSLASPRRPFNPLVQWRPASPFHNMAFLASIWTIATLTVTLNLSCSTRTPLARSSSVALKEVGRATL